MSDGVRDQDRLGVQDPNPARMAGGQPTALVSAANFPQDCSPGVSAHPVIHDQVQELLRSKLIDAESRCAISSTTSQQSKPSTLPQWLTPFLQQTILDAVQLGWCLREGPESLDPTALRMVADRHGSRPDSPRREDPMSLPSAGELLYQPSGDGMGAIESVTAMNSGGVAPWLVNGRVTLLAYPFTGFAAVQRFLRDLQNVPQIYDVKPKHVAGGRLYVVFDTDHTDTQTLVDSLETEFSHYRPARRSVQSNFIEILLQPSPEWNTAREPLPAADGNKRLAAS